MLQLSNQYVKKLHFTQGLSHIFKKYWLKFLWAVKFRDNGLNNMSRTYKIRSNLTRILLQ
jgi:hypothetical protein